MTRLEAVVAASRNGVIGDNGQLPWHIPSELRRFKQLTMGKPIIMGRRTWESLPRKPLPGRRNIVITRQADYLAPGAEVVSSKEEALAAVADAPVASIIGGGEVYRLFLPETSVIHLTEVGLEVEGDTRLPHLDPGDWIETARDAVAADAGQDMPGYVVRRMERKAGR